MSSTDAQQNGSTNSTLSSNPMQSDSVKREESASQLPSSSPFPTPISTSSPSSPTSETDLNLKPAPLATQTHSLLDPALSSDFDPDAFLVSRTPGTDLTSISKELNDYSKLLSAQLVDVINDDYRPFIQLGSNLKSEAHRIARLGWQGASDVSQTNASGTGSGTLGTDLVTETVTKSRNSLRAMQAQVKEVMRRREDAKQSKSHLNLLLELHASILRLESLLLIPSPSQLRRKRVEEGATLPSDDLQNLDESDQEEDPYLSGSMDDYNRIPSHELEGEEDEEEEDWWGEQNEENPVGAILSEDAPLTSSPRLSKSPLLSPTAQLDGNLQSSSRLVRRKSSAHAAARTTGRRRSSGIPPSMPRDQFPRNPETHSSTSATLLPLPLRLIRTAAEHSTLLFLRSKALSIALSAAQESQAEDTSKLPKVNAASIIQPFISAREPRFLRIRSTLLRDLRALLSALLRRDACNSYLLQPSPPSSSNDSSKSRSQISRELDSWSQIAPIGSDASPQEVEAYRKAREAEQRGWLEFALRTYFSLGQEGEAEALSQITQTGKDGEATKVLLDRLAETDGKREAERAVREVFVAPWARETITASSLDSASDVGSSSANSLLIPPQGGSDSTTTPDPLRLLCNRILIFASEEAREVSEAAERLGTNGTGANESSGAASSAIGSSDIVAPCDIYVNVIWDEISRRLMDDLGGQTFFVGRTDVFHRNYSLFHRFISSFLSLAPSPRAYQSLLRHPSYIAFRKRWQLPVYFQMRFREVVGKLEVALREGRSSYTSASNPSDEIVWNQSPLLRASAAALSAFYFPWKEGVHLPELAAREWKLSLQVLSRFKSWLDNEMAQDQMSSHSKRADALRKQGGGHSRAASGDGSASRPSLDGGARAPSPAVPSRTGTPTPSDLEASAASDEELLRSLTSLVADQVWLERETLRLFDEKIGPQLMQSRKVANQFGSGRSIAEEGEDKELLEALRATISDSFSYQEKNIASVGRTIVSILKVRCSEPLRHVRSISTQYRGTTSSSIASQADDQPSHFVPQILRPLHSYFGIAPGNVNPAAPARRLQDEVKSSWAQEIIEEVASKYATSLFTMNKNFESLQRLKRGNQSLGFGFASSLFGGAGAGAGASRSPSEDGNSKEGQKLDPATEKMRHQMEIDIKALEMEIKELQSVGARVQLEGNEIWIRLVRAARGSIEE